MIEINLLPASPKHTQALSLRQLYRMPLVWVVGGLVVGHILLLFILVQWRMYRLAKLDEKIQLLRPQQEQVQRMQALVGRLRAEETAFKGLGAGTIHLSERLLALAEAAPSTIWYSELVLDQREGIVIRGMAIAQDGLEMSHIGKLVEALSKTRGFVKDLGSIRIHSINRIFDKQIELVEFSLLSGESNSLKDK
jgi:Tfp pilus assembly protein PilN